MTDPNIVKYWQTVDALAAIDAKAGPVVAQRDQLQAEVEPKLAALNAKIREIVAPRYELSRELAFLTRALGGEKIAERPEGV